MKRTSYFNDLIVTYDDIFKPNLISMLEKDIQNVPFKWGTKDNPENPPTGLQCFSFEDTNVWQLLWLETNKLDELQGYRYKRSNLNFFSTNEDAYYHYKDYAYAAFDSKDPAEFPNPIDAVGASVVNAVSSGSNIKDKYGEEITGMSVVEVKIPYSEWTQEMKDSFNERKSGNKNESLYLKVRKNLKENAYMALLDRTYKPTERDYVKYAIDTADGRKQFDKDIKMVHEFIKKNPDKYEYVLKRYPKDDPRLSMLNYKMDRMTEASDKYLETQFPTNQDLFTKVKERTKKNMNLTDPKNFKPVKDPIKYVDVKKTKKLKETVTRHFNKPVKSKSMFGLNMGKVRKTNQKMIEKREQEQRVKEEEKAYIQEKMSRQKSNWKDDLTDL